MSKHLRIAPMSDIAVQGVHRAQGQPFETDERTARELVSMGLARPVPGVVAPVTTEVSEPVVETAAAAPAPETAVLRSRRIRK